MSIKEIFLTNTMGGKKEKFSPRVPGEVSIYVCGPTVYGLTHVGNARGAITLDVLRRIFRLAGYRVNDASNYTDVDDKIIKRAAEESRDPTELAEEFIHAYDDDCSRSLNETPQHRPRATEHIGDMQEMITGLIDKNLAYEADTPFGKDVYFRVRKLPQYGKLSGRKFDEMVAGARIEVGEAKDDPLDFALWKAAKPGEPEWKSPWGMGRPGWHIECSAMIRSLFPQGLDIHMGGIDLIFPHHENEIAQSEGFGYAPLARYWLHWNMLVIAREKMSKSLGNFFTTRSFLDQYGGEVLRLLILQQHYRSPVDFAEESIVRTEGLLQRLYHAKQEVLGAQSLAADQTWGELPKEFQGLSEKIESALFDDFNTAKALGFILASLRVCFRENRPGLWRQWGGALAYLNQIFGIVQSDPISVLTEIEERRLKRMGISAERRDEIEALLKKRVELRAAKQFQEADQLRQDLETQGIQVMDGPDGVSWTVKPS